MAGFMSQVLGQAVSFDPSQMVLTAGATPAVEILCFCLADQGNAILVPSPYYPGYYESFQSFALMEFILIGYQKLIPSYFQF